MLKKSVKIFLYLFIFSFLLLNIYKYFNHNIYYYYANYIADFSDYTNMVGASDNVFVWKVTKKIWLWKYWLCINNTDSKFEVEVLYNIKWNLKWTIIVKHVTRYDFMWNLHVSEWSNNLVENWLYLLSTRGEDYTINSHFNWSHLLIDNNSWNINDIKKFVKENSLVKEFRSAYKNEKYYLWELKISTEKNAYKYLWEKEKNDFENIDNGFVN